MGEERLQKLMARAGIASRRECETIIEQKRVTVNGKIATLGSKADPQKDDIRVDGARLTLPDAYVYIMLNKPRDVISDEDVGGNWPSARELIPLEGHLYPVGRLDVQSEGLMLFTNDGDLAHILTHPRYEHPKTYHVLVEGSPTEKALDAWRRGIVLDGERTAPAEVRQMRKTRDGTLLEVVMHEGRKRQVRRVAAALGYPALQLVRVGLGPLELGNLPSGAWRRLDDTEVQALRALRTRAQRQGSRPARSSKPRRSTNTKPRSEGGRARGPGRPQRSENAPRSTLRKQPSRRTPRRGSRRIE